MKLVEVSKRDGKQITPYQSAFSIGRIGDAAAAVTGLNSADFGLDEMGVFQNRPTAQFSSSLSKIKVSQRLLVASGKSAKINFDEDINVVLNAASGGGGNQFAGQTQRITRITAGNSMDITPIVGGGGVVAVKIEVEVSANDPNINELGVPASTLRRRISSEIQINDQETIAIGGLFDDQKGIERSNGIPFLQKIPKFRSLFGNSNRTKRQTELLVSNHP